MLVLSSLLPWSLLIQCSSLVRVLDNMSLMMENGLFPFHKKAQTETCLKRRVLIDTEKTTMVLTSTTLPLPTFWKKESLHARNKENDPRQRCISTVRWLTSPSEEKARGGASVAEMLCRCQQPHHRARFRGRPWPMPRTSSKKPRGPWIRLVNLTNFFVAALVLAVALKSGQTEADETVNANEAVREKGKFLGLYGL